MLLLTLSAPMPPAIQGRLLPHPLGHPLLLGHPLGLLLLLVHPLLQHQYQHQHQHLHLLRHQRLFQPRLPHHHHLHQRLVRHHHHWLRSLFQVLLPRPSRSLPRGFG